MGKELELVDCLGGLDSPLGQDSIFLLKSDTILLVQPKPEYALFFSLKNPPKLEDGASNEDMANALGIMVRS